MATCSGERGAGTMLAAGIALAMLMMMVLVLGLATAAVSAAKAATAADLAALAAADALRGISTGDPCQIAMDVAAANSATLVECAVFAGSNSVQVRVRIETALPWPAYGQARAGPPPDSVLPAKGHAQP